MSNISKTSEKQQEKFLLAQQAGRSSPLLARQRYLPIEMHAQLMPFNKSVKAIIPSLPHAQFNHSVASNRSRNSAVVAAASALADPSTTIPSAVVRSPQDWHNNRSISWSTKAAVIAGKIVEASQQRESRKNLRREMTATTTTPASVLEYDDHNNFNNGEISAITENHHLLHDDEEEDPSEIARTMLKKKLNLQQQQQQQQLEEQNISSSKHWKRSKIPPITADSDLANANWRILHQNTSEGNNNNNNIHQPVSITSGPEAIATSQQLQAQAFSQTGRGRERYPSHDDKSGATIRNDPSVAVQQVEPQNPFFVYHGSYQNNKKSGVGRYIVGHDGSSYVGQFSDGEIEGAGTRYLGDGTVMQGSFKDGELHGETDCVVMSCSGERYEGGFKYGRRDGKGTLTWRSGGRVQVADAAAVVDGDDDDEKQQQHQQQSSSVLLKEEAFHQFEGEFENGEPQGVGIQTTTKVRTMISASNNNDNSSVCLHSKIVDTVEGFFNGNGPQGSCTRNVNRKYYDFQQSITATSREYYEGTYVNGKEQTSSSSTNENQNVFKHIFTPVKINDNNNNNDAKKITYTGPMSEGMRTLVPNTLVLESIKVSPLIDFQQQQQQQVQTNNNNPPPPLGSGRKNINNNNGNNIQVQDNISWLQPVSIPTGQEMLTMKISLANLNGFRFPSSSSSLASPTSAFSTSSSSSSSCLIKEESGRLIQIQVFSVDLKQQTQLVSSSSSSSTQHLALAYALRAVYENLGIEELFLKNVLFGFSGKTLLDEVNNNNDPSSKNRSNLSRKAPTATKRQNNSNNNNNESEDLLEEDPDSENCQWEIELGIQTAKHTQFSNNNVANHKSVSTPRSSQQQQQQKIIPKATPLLIQKQKEPSTSSSSSPTVATLNNNNKTSEASNLFGLHLRTLMLTIFDSSSPGLSASAISSIINARKSFLESCLSNYCQLVFSKSSSASPSNNNAKRTICLQNGCSKEPLLLLSKPPTLLLTNYQYQHELQTELCHLAEEIFTNSTMANNNNTAITGDQQQRNSSNNNNNGAAMITSSPNVVAIISDEIKKEHNVIEISSDLYLQHAENIKNNKNNHHDHTNNDRSQQRKRGISLMANNATAAATTATATTVSVSPARNNNSTNNNKDAASSFMAMTNLVLEHMTQKNKNRNKSSSTSNSLRSKIAGASAYYFSSNDESSENNNGDSGRKSSRGGNTNSNLVANNSNKKWKNAAAANQQQQNCSQFIQLVQSNFIEIAGNGESTEINLQLAPLQANVGDLLFVVVKVASPNILMTPGAEEIDLTSRLVPLIIPVLVGGSFHSNNNSGPKSPRK